ncbi:MAG TPA: alpha/beta fold hydrolase [Segetibacter sp.]|jgi:pimeloyl-ACP methyl ester carboxylesterase
MKLAQKIFLFYYRNKFKALSLVSPAAAAKSAFELFTTPYTRRRTYTTPEIFKQAENLNFDFEGEKIQGFSWKAKTPNGHKILICHGFDSFSYKFERFIEPLLAEGFNIFAFDAPAHGLSTGKTINALLYSQLVLKVTDMYGPYYGIMAHSFGGIGVTLAIEKLRDKSPKKLVLIAPATETTRSINDFCRFLKISDRTRRELEKIIVSIGGQQPEWYSVARVIKSISIPTLWLHDKNDKITPYEDMEYLTKLRLQHVEFVITEGLGHSLYGDDKVANKIVEYLAMEKPNEENGFKNLASITAGR